MPLLLEVCGVFARGLEEIFSVIQFVDEATGGFIALEGCQVFSVPRYVGCGGLILLI